MVYVSALREIYEEFAMLTRVTNAITLQAAALRKSVKVREVIAELLGTNAENLTNLIGIDPLVIATSVQRDYELVKKFDAGLADDVREELQRIQDMNQQVLEELSPENVRAVDGSLADDFFRSVVNNSTAHDVGRVCDVTLVTDLANFRQTLVDSTQNSIFLEAVIKKTRQVIECLERIRNFDKEVNNSYLKKANVLRDFQRTISTISEFSEDYADMPSLMHVVEDVFKRTKPIWSTKRSVKVGALMRRSIEWFLGVNRKSAYTYTVAFPGKGEMAMVAHDLKSDWFTEKVSRGKSTKELETALGGVLEFGKRMGEVEEKWKRFTAKMGDAGRGIGEIEAPLQEIEAFDAGPTAADTLRVAKDTWTKCWTQKTVNETALDEAAETLKHPITLVEVVKKVQAWHKKLMREVDLTAVEDAFNHIGNIADKDPEVVVKLIERLEHFSDLEDFLEMIPELRELHVEYANALERVLRTKQATGPMTARMLDLKDLYKSSRLETDMACLGKEGKFDVTTIEKVILFIDYCSQLADVQGMNQTRTVLIEFEAFRNSLLEVEKFVKGLSDGGDRTDSNPALRLNNSLELTNRLGKAMIVLRQLTNAQENRRVLEAAKSYSEKVSETLLRGHKLSPAAEFFYLQQREAAIDGLLHDLVLIEQFAASRVRGKDLMEMRALFDEVKRIHGFPSFQYYREIHRQLRSYKSIAGMEEARKNALAMSEMDLNFAGYNGDLNAADLTIRELKDYFDDIFGLKPNPQLETRIIDRTFSVLGVVGMCVGAFLLLIIVLIIGYGFTKNGRKRYRMWYLYYFPNMDEFERRWRYSLFMDRTDMKNALIDAVHDTNAVNVGKAIRRGVYINVRNSNGKTALHIASENGYPDMVRMLIKAGADRTMLSTENKTAEQMVPAADSATFRTKSDKFKQVLRIYEKCRKKKYRLKVPDVFPVSSFHIYMHPETSNEASDRFFDAFPSIATNEALDTMTHCVVRTDANGVLETDDVSLLASIFNGTIIVSEQWMVDCVRDGRLIKHDDKYLVERVKYKGHVYENAVLPWSRAMAKGDVPFLLGAHVALVMKDCPKILDFYKIIKTHGGEVSETFPAKADFNRRSHPYLHADKGPLFIIHDNQFELAPYHNDPDRMYTLFTEPEFIVFLLKREIQRDTSPNPIPVKISDE
ncbi:unnamed protein product [Caenorhabditis sp. 36 PRJEB53466]|nr:unnamed protein product [Caenorhabditis sp. 36 PRJEB53466]